MQMYEVGGCVRDEIMGVPSKDIDFTVVLDDADIDAAGFEGISLFDKMAGNLQAMGFKIFAMHPKFLTVRAQFPRGYWSGETKRSSLTADFVLARKESDYTDGRRPDTVEPGTLFDDQSRRDLTMNSIAKDERGFIYDPFDGRKDIADKIIRAVGDPFERLHEDALRAVRALRFSVTKGFSIEPDLKFAMQTRAVLDAIVNKISDERIKDELEKMFRFDTGATLRALHDYPALTEAMLSGSVWLTPTMKGR